MTDGRGVREGSAGFEARPAQGLPGGTAGGARARAGYGAWTPREPRGKSCAWTGGQALRGRVPSLRFDLFQADAEEPVPSFLLVIECSRRKQTGLESETSLSCPAERSERARHREASHGIGKGSHPCGLFSEPALLRSRRARTFRGSQDGRKAAKVAPASRASLPVTPFHCATVT